MKKITFVTVAILVSVAAFAQRGIPRTDNVSVSSTVVKKTTKQSDYQKRFQQSVELGIKIDFLDKGTTGVNYIGGYRFSNHFFAGMGVGLEFAHRVAGVKEYVGNSTIIYSDNNYVDDADIIQKLGIPRNSVGMASGSLNRIAIPLYLHLKGYYMKTKWAPYSSLSLGGILAPKENGLYTDFSMGVDAKLNAKFHAYFALGCYYRTTRDTYLGESNNPNKGFTYSYIHYDEDCQDDACDLYFKDDHYHFLISDLYNRMRGEFGISLRVGVSF